MEYATNIDQFRELIIQHPELPVVTFVHVNDYDEAAYVYCPGVTASIGEVLDCEVDFNNDHIYTDRDDFEEDAEEHAWSLLGYDDDCDPAVLAAAKQLILKAYEPHWKQCIIVFVS